MAGKEDENRFIPFDAGWPQDLQHRADPNRITSLQVVSAGEAPAVQPSTGHGVPSPTVVEASSPAVPYTQNLHVEPSYYDVSILKPPPWRWEVAWYFFLGGLSAGAYVIARVAERAGGDACRDVGRAGAYTALLTFIPCPALLIHDLGDPVRFHHMLRVWKPSSPMNFGTWSIVGYGGMATAEALRQWMLDRYPPAQRGPMLLKVNRILELLHDALGIPFALSVAGYTGVLLSCTSNPLWTKNQWLGPLFSASAIGTGAAAMTLALKATGKCNTERTRYPAVLEHIDTAAHAVEAATLAGYFREAGEKAATLRRGRMKPHMALMAGALILGEVIKRLPLRGKARRVVGTASAVLSLASGFVLRWTMIHGGHEAANDPHTARLSSRPGRSKLRPYASTPAPGSPSPKRLAARQLMPAR
ncbi:MAG: NrfD/PsrC family molybdoenzyme membrane anchor subunit [Bacillota bacterium]